MNVDNMKTILLLSVFILGACDVSDVKECMVSTDCLGKHAGCDHGKCVFQDTATMTPGQKFMKLHVQCMEHIDCRPGQLCLVGKCVDKQRRFGGPPDIPGRPKCTGHKDCFGKDARCVHGKCEMEDLQTIFPPTTRRFGIPPIKDRPKCTGNMDCFGKDSVCDVDGTCINEDLHTIFPTPPTTPKTFIGSMQLHVQCMEHIDCRPGQICLVGKCVDNRLIGNLFYPQYEYLE